jgi:LCP family protein required for cell wall assembly
MQHGAGQDPLPIRGSDDRRSEASGSGPSRDGADRDGEPYRSPVVRARAPIQFRLMVIVGAVLVVLSAVGVVGDRVFQSVANSSVKQEDLLPADMKAAGKNISGPINILMLGLDGQGASDLNHSDSIIIAHVTAAHDKVYLVSLPRDTMVEVPAFPASGFRGGTLKLTESFAVGNMNSKGQGDDSPEGRKRGVGLLLQAINTLIPGMTFNAVAIINFVGFQKLVEALGGVDMCIDERVVSVHYARNGKYMGEDIYTGPGYVYNPGCRHLVPWEALDYVRQRENLPHGDYDRQRHQQQFMAAVFKELANAGALTDISKFSALKDALGQLLTLDLNGTDITDWIFSFKGLRPSDLTLVQTNGGTYDSKDVDGKSYQVLSDDSLRLMQALKSDQVASFLALHPTWIATSGAPTTATSTPAT